MFFLKKTWSRLKFYVLGPDNSDSSLKATYIVLFPGLNSPVQVKVPQCCCCFITGCRRLKNTSEVDIPEVFFIRFLGHNSAPWRS